ncbi:hypothetical protein HYR99_24715 [Candidatus Poribacteria bacterium]|nr:hypothetical protein [Candidatus Poribacteria bacterium]
MTQICWMVLMLLTGAIMGPSPLSAAADLHPNETRFERTSFRLISALGNQTLEGGSERLASEQMKSPNKAFLYSTLVPGAGQLYVGAKRGYLQIAAEAVLLTAYFMKHNSAENLRDDYREQVRQHVQFDGPCSATSPCSFEDWDPVEDYEHATLFDNWHNVYTDDNGKPVERTGKWYWSDRAAFKDETREGKDDSPQREDALKLRKDANDKFEFARTLLGVVILNHVVSAIDARIATKNYNKKYAPQATYPKPIELALQTTVSPHAVQSQVVLRKRF